MPDSFNLLAKVNLLILAIFNLINTFLINIRRESGVVKHVHAVERVKAISPYVASPHLRAEYTYRACHGPHHDFSNHTHSVSLPYGNRNRLNPDWTELIAGYFAVSMKWARWSLSHSASNATGLWAK